MKTIKLHLKAVDFKDAKYVSDHCGLANAIKRQLKADTVNCGVNEAEIGRLDYTYSEGYTYQKHSDDLKQATFAYFDNTTIRTITLTKA